MAIHLLGISLLLFYLLVGSAYQRMRMMIQSLSDESYDYSSIDGFGQAPDEPRGGD